MDRRATISRALIGLVFAASLLAGCTFSVTTGDDSSPTVPLPTGTGTTTEEADGNVYTGNGITFTYPAGWEQQELGPGSVEEGSPEWQIAIAKDENNVIIVRQYTLNQAITADNIEQAEPEITSLVKSLFEDADGSLDSGPTSTTVGGFPALQYVTSLAAPTGAAVQSNLTFIFDGTTEYFVNCQYTADMATDATAACDEVVSSFQVT